VKAARVLRSCAAAGALALTAAAPSRASPLLDTAESIGGNAGSQGVVSGPGAASTYFNPALLLDADEDVLLGFALVSEQVGVTLDGRRPGADVPLVVGGRDVIGPNGQPLPNDVVPTQWLSQGCPAGTTPGTCPPPGFAARPRQAAGTSGKTRTYIVIGIVRHLIRDRFTFGLYGMLPVSSFTTAQAFYADEREALFSNSLHPELYGDRLTSISLVLGGAFKLLPDLSVGASISLGLANAASSQDYVQDSANYDTLLLNNSVSTQVNVSPTLGARYRPVNWLRIAGVLHSPESFAIDTTVGATLPSGTQSGTERKDVYDWMPWSLGVGAEADVLTRGAYTMSLTGSLKYAFWSDYQDRHGESPSVYGADLAWRDTVSGAVGVRHKYKSLRGMMDLEYIPSPVPQQIGRSNYVDNDRFGLHVGADIDLVLGSTHLRPGLQVMGQRLVYRHNAKDDSRILDELPDGSLFGSTHDPVPGAQGLQTNNPGWPGFASDGWIWGGAFTLAIPL
jgi:long-chain fatty acid transport protein